MDEYSAKYDISKNPIIKRLLMSTIHKPKCHACGRIIHKFGIHISPAGIKYMVFCHGQVQATPLSLELLKEVALQGRQLSITDAFVPGEQLEIFDEAVINKMLTPPQKPIEHKKARAKRRRRKLAIPLPQVKLLEFKPCP